MKLFSTCFLAAILLTACGNDIGSKQAKTFEQNSAPAPVIPVKAAKDLTPIERGAKIYKRCKACHTLEEGGRSKLGPNLWNVYGSKTASKEGFSYSKAMKAADIIWTEETMDAYLKKPAAYMPGTRMSFIGLKKQEDRDAVQVFMKAKTTP